jgi:hypothetical protein
LMASSCAFLLMGSEKSAYGSLRNSDNILYPPVD